LEKGGLGDLPLNIREREGGFLSMGAREGKVQRTAVSHGKMGKKKRLGGDISANKEAGRWESLRGNVMFPQIA